MNVLTTASLDDASMSDGLFEASPDCVKLLDLDGRLLRMNRNGQCAMEIDDFTALCGRPWPSLWPADAQREIDAAIATARDGQTRRITAFCPTAKGSPRWWDVTVAPVPGPDGRVRSIVSISRDITELHQAKEVQREHAARMAFVLESAQLGTWELDLRTGEARTSLLHDRCFGYEGAALEWSYEIFMALVHPDDRAEVAAAFEQGNRHESDLAFECRVVWPDRSVHWIAVRGSFYRGETGPATRVLGTVADVTARKQAEQALHESTQAALRSAAAAETERRRLDALLESTPVGIAYADADGRLTAVNAALRDVWGDYPTSEGVAEYADWKGWWIDGSQRRGQRLGADDWPMARALRGEEVVDELVEIEPFGQPGVRRTILLRSAPMRAANGVLIGAVTVQQDISDRVRAERELRESERRFRTITDAMPQMVWSTRSDGFVDYFNRQWYEFTGDEDDKSLGEGWIALVHPEDIERVEASWSHSRATGRPYEIEYRLRHRTGEYRWVLARGVPVAGEDDEVRWMGTCTDLHEHRRVLDMLGEREEALRQADRRKDEFLAMLAHELRNPLAPISTAARLLALAPDDVQRVRSAGEVIDRQIGHLARLVDDLLDVSRVTRGLIQLETRPLELAAVVSAAVEQARPLITSRGHALNVRSGPGTPWVRGDRTRLVQVIVNLLHNAAKYTPPGGQITVELDTADGHARIAVADNGIGIDATLLPNVFELFSQGARTPDRAQGGLGIGLALVRSLVALHGGRIHAESAGIDAGSRFTLELPVCEVGSGAPPDARRSPEPGVGLRVLVVDDNVDAARLLADVLAMAGHEARAAHDAHEAIAAAHAHGPFDAFVLDIGLPGLTGYELARQLRAGAGGTRALYLALTGYGQPQDRVLSREAGFDHHLVKPTDAEDVLAILADAARVARRAD